MSPPRACASNVICWSALSPSQLSALFVEKPALTRMDAIPGTMYIEFAVGNDPEEAYIMDIVPRFSGAGTLVISQMLLSIWSIVSIALDKGCPHDMTRKYGLFIEGPKGTGKTTSLLYLWKKLRDNNTPVLWIGPRFGERCADYLRCFCERKLFRSGSRS